MCGRKVVSSVSTSVCVTGVLARASEKKPNIDLSFAKSYGLIQTPPGWVIKLLSLADNNCSLSLMHVGLNTSTSSYSEVVFSLLQGQFLINLSDLK